MVLWTGKRKHIYSWRSDVLSQIFNLDVKPNYTNLVRFEQLCSWSLSDSIDLMCWHIAHERKCRRGINNNISLINTGISVDTNSWSLLSFRFDRFEKSIYVILPFKAVLDARMMIRMQTSFASVMNNSRLYTGDSNPIVGDERNYIISMLKNRIVDGFSWTGNLYNYPIRRYRLNAILSSPGLIIDRTIDCHHKSGSKSIVDMVDDRFINLAIMQKDKHHQLHNKFGDTEFFDYRV